MPGVPAVLKINILTDATKAVEGMKDASNAADGMSSTLKKVAGAAVAGLGTAAVLDFGKASVQAAQESKVATARLEQIFSSMGDATGDAAQAAENYASALSAKIGVEDESIMAGQAQLATFGSVSSETARMAGIFDRATTAGADLAAAGFGSIESNAVQLGKALEDPTKGMTALAKSGVTFTDSQKEQIKAMQESGDLLGAQQIVLGAVEKQVGGTAEATSTSTGKMKVAFGEVQEQIGGFLLPIISTLANQLTQNVIPAISDFVSWLRDKLNPVIFAVMDGIKGFVKDGLPKIAAGIQTVLPYLQQFAQILADAVREALPHVISFAKTLIDTLVPAVMKIVKAVMEAAPPIMALAKDVFAWMAETILPLLAAAFEKIVPVVATMAEKLIQVVGWLAKNRDVLAAILIPIGAYIVAMETWAAIQAVVTIATGAWSAAQAILNAVMALNPIMLVVIAIAALVGALIIAYNRVGWFKDFVDAAFSAVVAAFNFLKDAAVAVFNWVSDHWPLLLAILTGPIGIAILLITKNFDTLRDAAMSVVNWVQDRFQDLTGFLSRIAGSIQGIMSSVADAIRYPIDAATAAVRWVTDKFNELMNFLSGLKDSIARTLGGVADAIKSPLNSVIRAWNAIQFEIPGIDVGPVHWGGFTVGTPDIPTLARGGMVLRSGMALVHEGEQFSGVGRGFSGPTTVNITVQSTGLGADAPQIQRAVVQALRGYVGRNGAAVLEPGIA